MNDLETKCFQIIATAGTARSAYIEATQAAKAAQFEEADSLLKEGDNAFLLAHHIHAEMIQQFANGQRIETNILLVHAEDLIMSAETLKLMALEFIDLYKQMQTNQTKSK